MDSETQEILLDVKTYLEHQKTLGNDYLPLEEKAPQMKKDPMKSGDTQKLLDDLSKELAGCTKCRLSNERNNIVFGSGNPNADLMFVGEAPGRDEDIQGLPFVGRAGRLLTSIIEAMGLKREDVYIGNVAKCRPPENRNPSPDEIEACEPFLFKQIEIIKPKVIVCLGTFAAQLLLKTDEKISALRGKLFDYRGTKLIPTYHPAFLLRSPSMKRPVWEDMQIAMGELKKSG